MGLLRQPCPVPPVQARVQGGGGVLGGGPLGGVAPHRQANQGHTEVQGPVELSGEKDAGCSYGGSGVHSYWRGCGGARRLVDGGLRGRIRP